MRVLIVKTSSLGDVIHTLPAVTEAKRLRPDIVFDWVVEESFAEIPAWHPAVETVIPVALRRWRRHPLQMLKQGDWGRFRRHLSLQTYDAVIDAQGLIKSAFLSRLVKAPHHGYDRDSIREPLAARAYEHRWPVSWEQHAVQRIRQLFSLALGYALPTGGIDYGLPRTQLADGADVLPGPSLMFLHGTARPEKEWPETYWVALGREAVNQGYRVRLPWGNDLERERAERIAAAVGEGLQVLPPRTLRELAAELAASRAVVAVDTGLGHLAAALGVPGLSLYGPTDPERIGALGPGQLHLCSADQIPTAVPGLDNPFSALTPERVWASLQALLDVPA